MKLRVVVSAFVLGVSVASCSGPRAPLNPPQLVTDSETDMALQLYMQATIMLAKYYGYSTLTYAELQDRSAKAGYNSLPFMPPVSVRAVPELRNFKIDLASTDEWRQYVRNSWGFKGLVAYYVKTGLRASQIVCRNYLLGLDEKNQYLEFLKKEFGVAGTLADGILLAVSANGTLLHAFALGRDAATGAVNAYEDYRFLNVDREAARSLVETAQSRYAAYFVGQINKSSTPSAKATGDLPEFFTFADALNAVSTIEYQCTRAGIRNLITRAVNNTPNNLEVDQTTGTIMFRTSGLAVGTQDNDKGVRSPEQPAPSGSRTPQTANPAALIPNNSNFGE